MARLEIGIDLLKDGDGKGSGLASAGLSLSDDIVALHMLLAEGVLQMLLKLCPRHTLDYGHDGSLLNGRRSLKTVGVDSAQELVFELHGIEAVGGLIVVGFDLAYTWRRALIICSSRESMHGAKAQYDATNLHRYPQDLCR